MGERPLLALRGVRRRFGGGDAPVTALDGVSLDVARGEYVAIMGPSGSGKSTLLNVLGLLDRPTAGEYRFDGLDTARLGERHRAGLRSSRLGFVFQSFHLLPYRTAVENVEMGMLYRRRRPGDRWASARQALARVGLDHRAGFLPGTLSGGERQRVAIARALVGGSDVLLADEPTGNLDSRTSELILDDLDRLHREGLTILVVTHDDATAARAGRVVRMQDGRVVSDDRRVLAA